MKDKLHYPIINPSAYISSDSVEAEIECIWNHAWHLAAVVSDMPNDLDYVCRKIGTTKVVIHKVQGKIIAYANVCPHRFSEFFVADRGNSPVQCPYHLWSFDVDGYPKAIPHRHGQPLGDFRCERFRLAMWQVEIIGAFVFISDRPTMLLRDYLGGSCAEIVSMSGVLGKEVHAYTKIVKANWKIISQNTVEFEHAFSVHPNTFTKIIRKPLTVDHGPRSINSMSYTTRLVEDRFQGPLGIKLRELLKRISHPFPDGYRHHLLFPATTLGTTDNRLLAIVDYQPLAENQTLMTARSFEFLIPDVTPLEAALIKSIRPLDIEFTARLFEEDSEICEAVQRGLMSCPPHLKGSLMPVESLVHRFQEIYSDWISGKAG